MSIIKNDQISLYCHFNKIIKGPETSFQSPAVILYCKNSFVAEVTFKTDLTNTHIEVFEKLILENHILR